MINLGINQYKIKEIKYDLKEGKTVIFKFHNFMLEDVDIVEEKNDNENKTSKKKTDSIDYERCKELIAKTKDVPYKVMEKVGTLYTFDDRGAQYEIEEDPYVANDERELPKQKFTKIKKDDELSNEAIDK